MRRLAISIFVCLVLVGGTAAFVLRVISTSGSEAEAMEKPLVVPSVKVQILESGVLEDKLVLTGGVDPWVDIILSSEGNGPVESLSVDEGDRVEAGAELARIDTAMLEARQAQAQAQLRLAEQELKRVNRLGQSGVTTQRDADNAIANRDVAAAVARTLDIQLKKSVLTAPIEGIVDRVFVDENEFTDTGKPLVRIVQTEKVKVSVGVPERDVLAFEEGAPVTVTVDALPDRPFQGCIHYIATVADPITRTFTAEIEVENSEGLIRPGMIARAGLIRNVYEDAVVVPIFSTVLLDQKRYVLVEEDGAAQLREVETGVIQGNVVQVTEGLEPGDRLIVVGQRDARPGAPVNVTEVLE